MGLLAAVKHLHECASDTIISILQKGVTAKDTDGVCSGRAPLAPAGLHQVSGLSSWRSWGCLLGVGSSRIAVLEGPVSPQDEVCLLYTSDAADD